MRRILRLMAVLLAAATPALAAGERVSLPPLEQARLLHQWAAEAADSATVESRARALRLLEDAIRLDPTDAGHRRLLGTVHASGRHFALARDAFQIAVALAPRDADCRLALALEWKREWALSLDRAQLDHAIAELDTATRLRPAMTEAWLRLAPLLYERGRIEDAAAAAEHALPGRWNRIESTLAVAYLSYRLGDVERADSLFRVVLPRLPSPIRRWFDDPDALLHRGPKDDETTGRPSASLSARVRPGGFAGGGTPPDSAAPPNEIELEYWSRVGHAILLFNDPLIPGIDARTETYARFGPPARVELNPMGYALAFMPMLKGQGLEYPYQVQVWDYPELGMRMQLQDRSLIGRFESPVLRFDDPRQRPDPAILAARHDLLAVDGGAMVFPTRPPSAQRLEVGARLERFEGEHGPRVLLQIEAPASPGDTLVARWAMFDAAGRRIAAATGVLGTSACEPGTRQEGQFSVDAPAGVTRVELAVRDTHRHRGRVDATIVTTPRPAGLAISDLVVSCGEPSLLVGESEVRLGVNTRSRVAAGQPLVIYLELYGLTSGPDGRSRFEYEYEVRAGGTATTGPTPVLASGSREETHIGAMRRQYVRVPVDALPAGDYRLTLRVRDVLAGSRVSGVAAFTRE